MRNSKFLTLDLRFYLDHALRLPKIKRVICSPVPLDGTLHRDELCHESADFVSALEMYDLSNYPPTQTK